jgi:hypothetical protein
MFCKSKRKYIDAIFFNSKLEDGMTDEELEAEAEYSSDRASMDYVMGDQGVKQMLERYEKRKDTSVDYVKNRIRSSIDDMLYDNSNRFSPNDYIDNYNTMSGVGQDEISVDAVAEEYLNNVHEYGKKDDKGIANFDNDDPDKIAKETDKIRDTSNDPAPSKFAVSFGWS